MALENYHAFDETDLCKDCRRPQATLFESNSSANARI